MKYKQGFTLLELLIVLSIISMITAIGFIAYGSAQQKSRDAKRKSDLTAFASHLGIFYARYGNYPCGNEESRTIDSSLNAPFLNGDLGCSFPKGLYDANLINNDHPKDPLNNEKHFYYYKVTDTRQSYVLYVNLENDTQSMQKDGGQCSNYYELGPGAGIIQLKTISSIPCN